VVLKVVESSDPQLKSLIWPPIELTPKSKHSDTGLLQLEALPESWP
jgi:hypothetical protein